MANKLYIGNQEIAGGVETAYVSVTNKLNGSIGVVPQRMIDENRVKNASIGNYSHYEGNNNIAAGIASHAEGQNNWALGNYSHVEGYYNTAVNNFTHVEGCYCISDSQKSDEVTSNNRLSVVGNGQSPEYLHNAFEIRQTGDIYVADVSAPGGYYEKPMIHLQHKLYAIDASIKALQSSGGGSGGGGDMTNYYDKNHIDASFNYVDEAIEDIGDDLDHLNSSKVESSSVYLKEHIDASYGIIDASLKSFDASIKALASSGGGGGGDMSNYATKSDISTFKPIVYIEKDDYDQLVEDEEVDSTALYVITDAAQTDELSNIVTIDALNEAKQKINDSLYDTADECIAYGNTSINYWKTTIVNDANSSINSIKNTAVGAVRSQQTTSVNAVNTAKNTAIDDISTQAASITANMKNFVVLTESDYQQISVPDSNTIYFITD